MAKKKEVIITCNATNVKAVIEGLERGMAALAKEEEKLLGTIKQRGYAEDSEKKRLKELEKAMDAMRTNVQKNREEQKKLGEVMKDLAGAKLKDLKKALQEGKNALNNMSAKDPNRAKLVSDLKKIQNQIEANTGAIKKQQSAWGSLGTTLKNLVAYAGVFAGFNKLKSLTEEVFKANLKLSDSLANIRKVSGLSMEAINQLYRNIAAIDSRNTIETLNNLAYTGAKLGIGQNYGVQGLTGFVKAAEQVQMALGEDMGEDALPALAKMTEVMGLIDKYGVEQSMQKAASAIFQLGATSTATGTNIVEFSKRLYGLANVSRVSTQDLLALGSASDAMGLMPEVSATAFNKLFTSVQRQHNLIEKTLGMTKGTIKAYYDEGKTMDAIVEIFERMNKKGNLNLLGTVFKDLGSDGARLVNVMATMADRVDILKKHLDTSRDAFKEGEAVIGEYMIQNQTAAALVERSSNLWAKAFTNPEGVDMVKEMAQAWYDLSKSMTQSDAQMKSLHLSIDLIALAVKTLIKLMPFLIRAMMMFGVAAAIRGVVTGIGGMVTAIRAATTAQLALNTAMKSNWFLAIASAVAAALTLLYDYSKAAEEAAQRETKRQAELKAAFDNSREAVESVVKPLGVYKKALDDASLSEKQRMDMVKQFKTDYQDYLDYLGLEITSAVDLAKAYAQVVKVMKQKKAYEERESFRQQKNGDNRMTRIENQAQVEAQLQSMGITGIDKKWLEKNQHLGTKGVYDKIMRQTYGMGAFEVKGTGRGRWAMRDSKGKIKEVGSEALWDILNNYIVSYRTERNTNKDIDRMFNSEYKDIDLEHFNIDEFNDRVQRARWKRKGSLDNEKPDKGAAAARRKALKQEMDEAKKATTGIISKLEEYYRLQEAAIQDARADGQLTEDQAKEMVRSLNIVKNESLATARRAVTTGDTAEWDELKTKVLPAVMSDTSDVSKNLLSTIQQVAVDKLHKDLAKFNGSSNVLGLDSRAFFDQMNAKAAGNTREAARLKAQIQNEIERALRQYQFVDIANDKMRKDLEAMGLMTETYEQFAKRMQQGIKEKPDTLIGLKQNQREQIVGNYVGRYGVGGPSVTNTNDVEQMQNWLSEFSQGGNAEWSAGLPNIKLWLKDAESYLPEIQRFYATLEEIRSSALQREKQGENPLVTSVQQNETFDQLFGRSISDKDAYRQMGNKFIQQGVINFKYNIENQEEAEQWLSDFATSSTGALEDWAEAFPDLIAWIDLIKRKEAGDTLGEAEVEALGLAMPRIRNLYNEMLNHSDRVNKAIKQAYEHEKQQQDIRFQAAGYRQQEEETDKSWESVGKQKDAGIGQTLAEQIGVDKIADDPEIQRIQNRIYWRNKELEEAQAIFEQRKEQDEMELQALRDRNATEQEIEALRLQQKQDNAGIEELIKDRQTQLFNETNNLAMQVAQQMQKRVSAINSLVKPVTEFTQAAGRKIGDMITNMESEEATWEELWKNMVLAVGESVIQMGAQYAQNLIMQQAINRASEAEAVADAGVKVSAGIAAGSAKTIGELGWWGIPLIAVISSLLMDLLQSALSTKSSKDGSSSSAGSSATPKTKLVSGMLTYDKGNVDRFAGRRKLYDDGTTQVYGPKRYIGQDGKVYTATEEPAPKGGLVTHPIATTVEGQPALVAEKGPEIVIGRETTANIMRNAPELLQAIVDIDKNPHKKTDALPTYDKGNVSEVAGEAKAAENSEKVQEVTMRVNRDNRYHTERQDERNNEEQSVAMSEESLQRMMEQFRKTRISHEATNKHRRQQEDSRKESMRRDSVTTDAKDSTESLTRWFRDFATAEMTTQYVTLGEWARAPESHIGEIKQLYKVLSSHDEQTRRSDQQAIERTMDTINNVKDITSVKAESENTVVSEEALSKMTAKFRTIEEQRRLDTNDTAAVTRWLNDFVTTTDTSAISRQTSDIKNREVREQFVKSMPAVEQWQTEPEKHVREIIQLYNTLATHDEQMRRSEQEHAERSIATVNDVMSIIGMKTDATSTDRQQSVKITEDIATEMVRKHRQVEEQRRLREEQEQKRVKDATSWLRDFVTTDVTSLEDVRSQKEDVTKKLDVSSKKSDVQDTSTVSHQTSDIKNSEVRESFTKAMPHVDEWLKEPEKHVEEIMQLRSMLTRYDEQLQRSEVENAEHNEVDNKQRIARRISDNIDRNETAAFNDEVLNQMVSKHRSINEQRRLREEQEQKRSSVDKRSRIDVQDVRRTFDKGNMEEVTKRRRLDTSNTEEMTRWLNDFVTTDVTSLEDVRSQKEDVTKKSAVSSKKSDIQDTLTVSRQTSDIKNREVRESFTKAMPHVDEWLQEPEKYQQEIAKLYTTLTDIDERERISREESSRMDDRRTDSATVRRDSVTTDKNIALTEQYYKGEDGRTYKAQPGAVPEGVTLLTKPIATMINGEPSLVAEKGPELVIGRETTKAMQLNRPDLLRAIVSFDKNKTQQSMRMFDQGNIQSIGADTSETPVSDANEERQALRQQMTQMQDVMNGVLYYLQHPVRPKIDMYSHGGEDGLYDSMKKATKFMSRYGG